MKARGLMRGEKLPRRCEGPRDAGRSLAHEPGADPPHLAVVDSRPSRDRTSLYCSPDEKARVAGSLWKGSTPMSLCLGREIGEARSLRQCRSWMTDWHASQTGTSRCPISTPTTRTTTLWGAGGMRREDLDDHARKTEGSFWPTVLRLEGKTTSVPRCLI